MVVAELQAMSRESAMVGIRSLTMLMSYLCNGSNSASVAAIII